jgi:hypothetical protein
MVSVMSKARRKYAHAIKKVAFITVILIEDPEPYEGKITADIEKEILEEIGPIPYAAKIEKVTVLDFNSQDKRKSLNTVT